MDCIKINIGDITNKNFFYPIIGLCGLCMTYFGNRFVRPTIFSIGTLLSTGGSYKLANLIMNEFNYKNCLLMCGASVVSGFSGGFLAIKLYKLTYFCLGFICGGMLGYLLYDYLLFNYKLGVIFNRDIIFWLSLFIPGGISGTISLYKRTELSIMTTSFIGPLMMVWSFSKFTNYQNLLIYIPTFILLSLSGLFIQYKRYKNKKNIEDKQDITYIGINKP